MLNKDTFIDQSIQKDKRTLTFQDRDLFPIIMGRSSPTGMSAPIYPFIVDWQLMENEKQVEVPQL